MSSDPTLLPENAHGSSPTFLWYRTKAFYTLHWGASSFLSPYLPIYFKSLGLTPDRIGLLGGLRAMITFIGSPLLTGLADAYQKHRVIFLTSLLLSGVGRSSLLFSGSTFYVLCILILVIEFLGSPINALLDNTTFEILGPDRRHEYGKIRMWGAVGWGIFSLVSGAIISFTSIYAGFFGYFSMLSIVFGLSWWLPIRGGSSRSSSSSSKQISSTSCEQDIEMKSLLQNASFETESTTQSIDEGDSVAQDEESCESSMNSVPRSSLERVADEEAGRANDDKTDLLTRGNVRYRDDSSIDTAATVEIRDSSHQSIPSSLHPSEPHVLSAERRIEVDIPSVALDEGEEDVNSNTSSSLTASPKSKEEHFTILRKLVPVLCRLHVLAFFFIVYVMGCTMGLISNVLFLYLDELGGSSLVMGLSLTITCISEVPLFWFAGRIIQRLGIPIVLFLCLFCYILRLIIYATISSPWMVLPIELVHGITYGLMWASCTMYARMIAPPSLGATLQGILGGTFWSVGAGSGSYIGGVMYAAFGARKTFLLFAAANFCGFLVYLPFGWMERKAGKLSEPK